MALHILPAQRSFGQEIGSTLGTGLGQGLSMLAQDKIRSMQANKLNKTLGSLGISPEQADILNHLREVNPQMYSEYLGRALENSGVSSGSAALPEMGVESTTPVVKKRVFEKGVSEKEKAERYKQTKDYRQSILDARKASKSDLRDLSRLEELNQKGELDTAGYVQFLSNSGLDVPALMSEDSQEFAKIQQSFLKNIKNIFGARVSNFEVEQFLKTIPSLSQTPMGRARVIANLKLMARGSEEYYKAYEDVLKENKGVPPLDVQEQVERKIDKDKRLDRIYNQFKEDLKKTVPKGQNKIITGLQAGAGSLVKPLAGAASGALIGSVIPGIGTGLGALGGGAAALGGKLTGLI